MQWWLDGRPRFGGVFGTPVAVAIPEATTAKVVR